MTIAIGDVHGCLEPLQRLIDQLPRDAPLVFLGDYVDRGPDSSGVLRYLESLAESRPCEFLVGNHEDMMDAAIRRDSAIPLWLTNGGEETLHSYGEDPESWEARPPGERTLPGFERFYARLRLIHEDADAIYVHAGIDVNVPDLAAQKREVLLWVRDTFVRNAQAWPGKRIIFGHTPTHTLGCPVGAPYVRGPLRGIDTGCVYGGALTAIDPATDQTWQVPNPLVNSRYRI